ncbi:MAG: hypothetical protein GX631_06670 [Dehalococcoidales bacterium]|jgi:hypothetical protein|nr:hypothetical protein [Dehalococcoidales bacterium]
MKKILLCLMPVLVISSLLCSSCSITPPKITLPAVQPSDEQHPSTLPSETTNNTPEPTYSQEPEELAPLTTKVEIITPFSEEAVYIEVKGGNYPLTRENGIYASGIVELAYGDPYTITMGDQRKEGVFNGGYHEYLEEAHRTGFYPWSSLSLPDELLEIEEFLHDFIPMPGMGRNLVKGFYTGAYGDSSVETENVFFDSVRASLPKMAQAGAEWINLVPMWFFFPYENESLQVKNDLRPIYRDEFHNGFQGEGFNYPTYDDDELKKLIRDVRAAGFKVYLVPHITPANWGPETAAGKPLLIPDDINVFIENYKVMIAHYAQIAEETGVELLGLGCENDSLTIEEQNWYPGVDLTEKWYEIIEVARSHYSGKLTYSAAAGDIDYSAPTYVQFWDALDYIGFEWYLPVTDRTDITIPELIDAARDAIEKLAEPLYEQYKKPLLFTEVGFEAKPYAWTRSYEGSSNDRLFDRMAAAVCYEYLFQAIEEYEFFNGMFIWSWAPSVEDVTVPGSFPWDLWWAIVNDGNEVQHSIIYPQISKWFHYYSE